MSVPAPELAVAPTRAQERGLLGRRSPLAVGLGALLLCWGLLSISPTYTWQVGDISLYRRYGRLVVRGLLPYRDFHLEYPPGSLLPFALPEYVRRLVGHGTYPEWFRLEVLVLWIAMLVVTAWALRLLGAPRGRAQVVLLLVGASPLLLGADAVARYDVWPALFTGIGVVTLLAGRPRLACAALAAGVAAKIYPLLLLPLPLVVLHRRGGVRAAAEGVAVSLVVGLAAYGLFLVEAPRQLLVSTWRQAARPVQVESGVASLWSLAHVVGGLHVRAVHSYGSDNIATPGTHVAGLVSSLVCVAAVLAVWWFFARSAAGPDEIVLAAAACVAAYLAFGKVFSPQYMIWLFPLVPLLRGRLGLRAMGLLVGATVLTQVWSPFLYSAVYRFNTFETILVAARNLLVLVLFALLLRGCQRAARATA